MAVNLKTFFDRQRKGKLLGPVLDMSEVQGLDAIIKAAMAKNVGAARLAYMLATTYHETAGTMQPIKERGGNGYLHRMYDINGSRPALCRRMGNIYPGDGIKFCGRGFVQLTWRTNYEVVGKRIGVDLVNNPDAALTLPVAARILVEGMLEGWFTGRSLKSVPSSGRATQDQFVRARPIINGTDKALKIANYALTFQEDLLAAGFE